MELIKETNSYIGSSREYKGNHGKAFITTSMTKKGSYWTVIAYNSDSDRTETLATRATIGVAEKIASEFID